MGRNSSLPPPPLFFIGFSKEKERGGDAVSRILSNLFEVTWVLAKGVLHITTKGDGKKSNRKQEKKVQGSKESVAKRRKEI